MTKPTTEESNCYCVCHNPNSSGFNCKHCYKPVAPEEPIDTLDDQLKGILRTLCMEVAEVQKRGAKHYDWLGTDVDTALRAIKDLFSTARNIDVPTKEALKKYNWSSDKDYQLAVIAFKDLFSQREQEAYKKGYIDGGIGVLND